MVGPSGSVTAVDIDTVLLELIPAQNLTVQQLDVRTGELPAGTYVQNIRGRDRGALYFKLSFAEVRDRVIDSGRLDAATLDAASGLLDDPDYWTQCWMMTAVWARKPMTASHGGLGS